MIKTGKLAGLVVLSGIVAILTASELPLANAQSSETATPSQAGSNRPTRGIIRADRIATLSSKLFAPIYSIEKKPGERFQKDDVLVTFDCREFEADFEIARAESELRNLAVKNKTYLKGLGAAGTLDVSIARAELKKAQAKVRLAQLRMAQCVLRAPFNGAVVKWSSQPFDTIRPGTAVMEIVGLGGLSLEIVVPSKSAANMTIGRRFEFLVDETGAALSATITRKSVVVDPVSQTGKIYGRIENPPANIQPGMSGSARNLP
ncbi:MAG: HlyD family efflux transporter periplasmic adaptor subunit [Pseudomonadota bacterium]